MLKSRGVKPITLGSSYFTNEYPMLAIKEEMNNCSGIMILGIPQILVTNGISKPKTQSEKRLCNKLYPSVWNQIEGAMAFILELPTMIISEKGLQDDGLFGNGVLPIYKHEFDLSSDDWLNSQAFLDPFNQWMTQVQNRKAQ